MRGSTTTGRDTHGRARRRPSKDAAARGAARPRAARAGVAALLVAAACLAAPSALARQQTTRAAASAEPVRARPTSAGDTSRPGLPAPVAEAISRRALDLMQKHGFPGFSVGVVAGDELVYAESFGVADRDTGRPADRDTLYQIGSVSKVFTATLLGALRDRGLVRLDDPAAKYLPPAVKLPTDPRGASAITLRHLATHTSGLPADVPNPSRAKDGDPWLGYSLNDLRAGMSRTKLAFPTGERWGYSNLGYGLLGLALERAAGRPYEQLLRQYVFAPLRMTNSTVTLGAGHRRLLATPYRDDDPKVKTEPWDMGVLSPAGGVASSVADLAKFLSLQFRAGEAGVVPVSGSTLLETQTPQRFIADWSSANGLGWRIDRTERAGNVVSHGGDVDGYASYVAFSPVHKVGVVVLTNSGMGRPVGAFGAWLMELAVGSIRPTLARAPTPEEANAYHSRDDWKNAAWAYEKITAADASNGAALSRLGLALLRLQRYDEAAAAYEKALAVKFRTPSTMYNLACVYALKGDRDKAIGWLERALAAGLENRAMLQTDTDLDNLRGDERFQRLLRAGGK